MVDRNLLAASKSPVLRTSSVKRNVAINAVIFLGVLYLFGRQLSGLSVSLSALRHANIGLTAGALVAVALSFGAATLSYRALSLKPLKFWPTLYVQVASGFVNRLLPAGLGSMGLFAAYYHRHGHALATSSALVATNNILGFVGNTLLLAVILVLRPEYIGRLHPRAMSNPAVLVIIVGIVLLGTLFAKRSHLLRHLVTFARSTYAALRLSLRPGYDTGLAMVCNMVVTSLNVLALSLAVTAAHGVLDWPAALVVLSLGTLVGAAVPTPGGIGGVEAGLLAGMLAFGVSSPIGLAAVLLYRGMTYWLPIIPGVITFRIIEKRLL